MVESTFELKFTRIAAAKVHSFYYDKISTSKTKTSCYFAVVFVAICVYSTMFYKNIFSIEQVA